jgi:hypothetical protein
MCGNAEGIIGPMVVHCCDCRNLVSDKAENCPLCGFDMRLPVSGELKKKIALDKLRRSQAWVVASCLYIVLTTLLSVQLIGSARSLRESQQASTIKPDSPRQVEIEAAKSNYESSITLAVLFGIGGIVMLTLSVRRYNWHNYLYKKEFGRSRRKSSYSAPYPGASHESNST